MTRDGDVDLIRERYTLLPGATPEGMIIMGDLVRSLDFAVSARDERDALAAKNQDLREKIADLELAWDAEHADLVSARAEIAALREDLQTTRDLNETFLRLKRTAEQRAEVAYRQLAELQEAVYTIMGVWAMARPDLTENQREQELMRAINRAFGIAREAEDRALAAPSGEAGT